MGGDMKKHLYSLIYTNNRGDRVHQIVLADNYFIAQNIALEDVKQWEGFRVCTVEFLNKNGLETGEVTFVG